MKSIEQKLKERYGFKYEQICRDDTIIRYLHKEGFRISAQDTEETRLDKNNSRITIIVRN